MASGGRLELSSGRHNLIRRGGREIECVSAGNRTRRGEGGENRPCGRGNCDLRVGNRPPEPLPRGGRGETGREREKAAGGPPAPLRCSSARQLESTGRPPPRRSCLRSPARAPSSICLRSCAAACGMPLPTLLL